MEGSMNSFLKNYPEDIRDEDLELHLNPHLYKFQDYLRAEIIPEMCAYWIASGYFDSSLFEDNYDIFIRDVLAMFGDDYKLTDNLRNNVTKVLRDKYNLIIKSVDPLDFERRS